MHFKGGFILMKLKKLVDLIFYNGGNVMNLVKTIVAIFVTGIVSLIGENQHQFIAIDNGANKLIYVNQVNPANNWQVKVPKGSRDLQLISKNSVLVSHGDGAGEYRLSDGKLLKLTAKGYKHIQTARRLRNGHTLLGDIRGQFYIIDETGKEVKTFKLEKKIDMRLIRFNAAGNMIIGTKFPRAVLEVDMNGTLIKELALPHKGYKVIEKTGGNLLATTGDAVKVVELDPEGKIIRFVGGKLEHPSLGLDFFSGFDTLANGNIVAANWLGHGKHGTAAHLIEFDANNKVVWKWSDHKMARQITNFLILDNFADVANFMFLYDNKKRLTPAKDMSVKKAYDLQDSFAKFQSERLGKVSGYKVAYASKSSQQKWNILEPAAGPLFAQQEKLADETINKDDFFFFHIETEVAFVMKKSIDKPISTLTELADYVGSVHVGLDIPDNRFAGKTKVCDIVMSGAGAHFYAIGPGKALADVNFKNMKVTLQRNGKVVYEGPASAVMGDPRQSVIWLANNLLKRGKKLHAGQVVLSGAVGAAYCAKGDEAKGNYTADVTGLAPFSLKVE